MKTGRLKYDFAYGCFLLCGVTVLSLIGLRASYTDAEWSGGAGGLLLIFLPVILAAGVAMLVGIALGIQLWRHWPLIALAGMSVLFITESLIGYGSVTLQNAVSIAYGAGATAMSGLWFLVLRKRHFPAAVEE